MLAVIACLFMLNYEERKVEVFRYVVGFVCGNVAYALGRPAVLKQLQKSVGALHYSRASSRIQTAESLGLILGALWSTIAIEVVDSYFLAIVVALGLQAVMMIVTLIQLEVLMIPHWSH
jgi:hypothetical protein